MTLERKRLILTDMAKIQEKIRIGTRASKLALAQAHEVKEKILNSDPEFSGEDIEIVKIKTTGDQVQDKNLAEIGGKGLFTKEIEEALFDGSIDIAVHSMKDMPDKLPDSLVIDCILEREDPRDAFISLKAESLDDLPEGAVIGTSSIRRQSQILSNRPDLKIVPFRGNVDTRLEKLERGDVDATILATAGLNRIGLAEKITSAIDTEIMLPAVAQGAIGVERLEKNENAKQILEKINHEESRVRIEAEREFLITLGGSCVTPIGALAEIKGDKLFLRTLIAAADGSEVFKTERRGSLADAKVMGKDAGEELKDKGKGILEWGSVDSAEA